MVVHAFPEYSQNTGEACATCHVNPGGGGPRTLRGALWASQGRLSDVPALPNVLLAPGIKEGWELYEIGCSTCHGLKGEGLFGREIANTGLPAGKIRTNIVNGRIKSGMPAFKGMFTDPQLQALVDYTLSLASGKAEILPAEFPLAAPSFECKSLIFTVTSGGN